MSNWKPADDGRSYADKGDSATSFNPDERFEADRAAEEKHASRRLFRSGATEMARDSRTWTAGIDAMRRYDGRDQWHLSAIEFHDKDRAAAERLRDQCLAAVIAEPAIPAAQVCGACGQVWTGEKCGQADNGWQHEVCYPVPAAEPEAVAWEFRQRSGVGNGPQSQAPWGDWCGIARETYERYVREPNKLVEVRALYARPVR
jgi:hypothetical protein